MGTKQNVECAHSPKERSGERGDDLAISSSGNAAALDEDDKVAGDENRILTLEPKEPRRSISLPIDSKDLSVNHNEEFLLKLDDPSMKNTALYRLDTFRRNGELCDVVLFVREKEIRAHKVVLAACSPALYDMFVQGEREAASRASTPAPKVIIGATNSVDPTLPSPTLTSPSSRPSLSYYEMAQTDYECFDAIVNYAYTANLEISNKKVGELYKTAHALQVTALTNACAQYLIQNLNIMNCLEIRRQINISDDELVGQVDTFISANFPEIVEKNPDFTSIVCITVRLILEADGVKGLCYGDELAQRALLYFQGLPHSAERIDQWIEQLAEKTHMLYVGANTALQDCSEMDDQSVVGASDIIQDYKRTGGYLPRTYSGCNVANDKNTTHHVTGATPVVLTPGRINNTKFSSAESVNSVLSSSTEAEEEIYKLIAVQRTAGDFWTALTVFHRRMVTLSMQLSEAEHVAKVRTSTETSSFQASFPEQEDAGNGRLVSPSNSQRSFLPQMCCARCSVGAALLNGKIVVCGGYNRGECLKTVEEYIPAEGKWRRLPDMHTGRGRFDAATVNGKLYAVAGAFFI